jgi:hypothetical protein
MNSEFSLAASGPKLASVVEAGTRDGEQLVDVVVRHLVAIYRSVFPEFLLAPVHADTDEEVEATTKEDLEVDTVIANVVPQLQWA